MLARYRVRRAAAGYGQPEVTAATASSGTAKPISQICTLALSGADQHHVDHIGGFACLSTRGQARTVNSRTV